MHVLHGKYFSNFQEVSDVIDLLQNSIDEIIDTFFESNTYSIECGLKKPKFVLIPAYPAENNWADISISVEFESKVISQIIIIKCK